MRLERRKKNEITLEEQKNKTIERLEYVLQEDDFYADDLIQAIEEIERLEKENKELKKKLSPRTYIKKTKPRL